MQDYQRKKGNRYILPTAVYNQVVWIIRDYYRMKDELADIITQSGSGGDDGMPRGTGAGDQTYSKVLQRDELYSKTKAIEHALEAIPEEYRRGVWDNIQKRKRYPYDADRTTYGRYKSKMVYLTAKHLHLI